MGLCDKIKTIYPELIDGDFDIKGTIRLQNDGQGDYIAMWEHPTLEQPTEKQLAD